METFYCGAAARTLLWSFLASGLWATPGAIAAHGGCIAVSPARLFGDGDDAGIAPNGIRIGRVDWTSYLRAGPGVEFAALDEIEGLTWLEVEGCSGGWCRVRTGSPRPGYLPRAAVSVASNSVRSGQMRHATMDASGVIEAGDESDAEEDVKGHCFRAWLTGYVGHGDPVQICRR